MAPSTVVYVADPDEAMTRALSTLLGCYGITVHAVSRGAGLLEDLAGAPGDGRCLLLAESLPVVSPSTMELEDGTRITLRMMRPEDADMEQAFVSSLSDRSR